MVEIEQPEADFADLKVGASAYALATVFGPVAFPPGMPDYQQIAILEAAERERKLGSDVLIDTRADTEEERVRKDRDNGNDNLSLLANIVQQQLVEAEHERLWTGSSHTYAGQTLSGEDWKRMMDWFGDDDNVAAWEDAMMAETGQSRDQVRQTGGKMKRFYDLMGKDAKGTLTDEERREFDMLGKDTDVRQGVDVQQRIQGIRADAACDQTAQSETRLDGDESQRANAKASIYDDDLPSPKGLAAVPALKPAYEAALARTSPAAVPSQPLQPAEIAATNKVTVSPDNMFG